MTKRILIVDDSTLIRRKIREIAESAGWETAGEAKHGEEAVTMYEELKPDLVTLDIVMPIMDGVDSLRAIIQKDPNAQVVMVSAVNQKDKLEECISSGALDFIVKPFDPAELADFFQKRLKAEISR